MTAALDYLPTWDGDGRCAGLPDLMADPGIAITLCLGGDPTIDRPCPVLNACRAWVLSIPIHEGPDGIVAGLTYAERERIILGQLPPKQCADCHEVKPVHEFAQNTEGKEARRIICRPCMHRRSTRSKTRGTT